MAGIVFLKVFVSIICLEIIYVDGTISHSSAAPPNSLKWVRVSLPAYRKPGESAHLECNYDLGNETLYAVKWYKENEEFYRFVPKERPQASSHRVDGVHVDISLSDSRKVTLRTVNLRSSGLYRCEVSAEAPSFASAQSEARMIVVALPKDDPLITGVAAQYQIGDEIDLNCTSAKSFPPSTLHWFINEQQVRNQDELIYFQPIRHRHGLYTAISGLRFALNARHFLQGSMRVKCVAFVSPVERSELFNNERSSIVEDLPILQDKREALLLVKNQSTKGFSWNKCLMGIMVVITLLKL